MSTDREAGGRRSRETEHPKQMGGEEGLILTFDVAQALASKAEVVRGEKRNMGRAQVMRVGARRPNQGAGV